MAEMDTELLLAQLASILPSDCLLDQGVLLNALVQANGDVQAAADIAQRHKTRGVKRRRDLDDWLRQSSPSSSQCIQVLSVNKTQAGLNLPTPLPAPPSPLRSAAKANGSPLRSINDVLRAPGSSSNSRSKPIQLPPLTLSNPEMVASHTPCSLHNAVLPTSLACQLYYSLLDKAKGWNRNKWWLFDRVVESPHRTSFFVRDIQQDVATNNSAAYAQYWYNGRPSLLPESFTAQIEAACEYVERIVNEKLTERERFPLEWEGSEWRANVAAANCYTGSKESVGFHSDQLTYLGPCPTIASLSLGTTRLFRLREVVPKEEEHRRKARTFDIPLSHNSLVIMHSSTQENFKHAVPPQRAVDSFHPAFPRSEGGSLEAEVSRINITFRFYRPDFEPSSIPRCSCGVPCILRPDMKGRSADGQVEKYWWACYAGAQNDGMGCSHWQVMDIEKEGRGGMRPMFRS